MFIPNFGIYMIQFDVNAYFSTGLVNQPPPCETSKTGHLLRWDFCTGSEAQSLADPGGLEVEIGLYLGFPKHFPYEICPVYV